MKSTNELKNEHKGIQLMLRVLEKVSESYGRGEEVDHEHIKGILEFLTVFVDRCHHGKEEDFLFPAMEAAGVPREGGPIGVMLSEHEEGRKIVGRLKDALGRHDSGDGNAVTEIQTAIGDYVTLLTQHIEKENSVLFEMADKKLGADKDAKMVESFQKLELGRVGVGKHEEYHALLDRLRETYLT